MSTQTLPSAPPAATTAGGSRLPLLDVLRGAAILGTLMTNVWIFAAPGAEWGVLTGATGSPSFDSFPHALEAVLRLLANGKFLALLTVLFGVGLAIQYASAERRGQPWPGRYRWRALFLFFEGTVHFVLIFAWDVLMGYAVTALLVASLLTRSVKARNRVMWWLGGLHLALMLLFTAVLAGADGGAAGKVDDGVRELYAHGGWDEQIAFRLENALALRMEPVLTFPLLVFLFLLGVRLFRAGAFGPDATGRRIRSRLLAWGLGLGLPISVLSSLAGPELFLLDRYIGGPLTALGYLGLTGFLLDRVRRPGPLLTGLTSVGRTALSGYVLQNLLCMLAAYGIGLGLTERLGDDWHPWWVIALWTVVCAILMLGSSLWLRRFSHGPLEQVQRWALRR
ncbi:DUF418 domain-containing protein [Streptomyces qinzhouensis]|uniref:DUF418 domain-containing protein n=1 Tax=Streptomyces qinzhouensis TaxID=2599401 RepID=A0A5B8JCS5_9ACTN|nr:DUF418 domain-containing protein [Streptomyces qinzhouensis]QDY77721.1 DUF418 domain-containing protein [Streptomyces qinzhouensis]